MAEFSEVIKQRNRMCEKYRTDFNCSTDCPLNKVKLTTCGNYLIGHPQKAEALIMDWAKEHPIQTNADKFKEVFGYDPDERVQCSGMKCMHLHDSIHCDECECSNFWEKEYKEQKE